MNFFIFLMLGVASLHAAGDVAGSGMLGQPPAPGVPSASSTDVAVSVTAASAPAADPQSVEMHFQAARKFYLDGDRDSALRELNQALTLNPYHPASTELFQIIREEERSLRQVRLVAADGAAAISATVVATPQAASDSGHSFWHSVVSFERKADQRLDGLDRSVTHVEGEVTDIQTEVAGQKDMLQTMKDGMIRIEGRQDNLMLGLLALLIALIVLLIMTLRMLMNMRGEIHGVESKMHDHVPTKRR